MGSDRLNMLAPLKEVCKVCRMCELGWSKAIKNGESLDPHVFSNYDSTCVPRFMIVGQNPGWNEVKKGTPFIGDSGDNFDKALLLNTRWRREDFYITNCIKCFTEGNRPPTPKQLAKCEPFLKIEIEIIKPIMVIAFGAAAFGAMCEGGFSDRIGKITVSNKFGVKVFTTYHPSPLNLADPARKKVFFENIVMIGKIMNKLLSPF